MRAVEEMLSPCVRGVNGRVWMRPEERRRNFAMIRQYLRIGLVAVIATVAGGLSAALAEDAAPADPDLVARGHYLALAGDCMPCHTGAPKEEFAGGLGLNTPFGTIYSPNITPDDETGIGKWTFEDFKNAVHDGIRADGAYLYPAMPYDAFTKIEEKDLEALWAYLRSLKPINKPQKANGLGFPFNIREMMFFWRVLFFDDGYFKPDKAKSETWNRGAYLVEALAHCNACHTPRNLLGATIPSERFEGAQIDNWYAPDITEKALKEVNKWDTARMVDFLKKGAAPNSTTLGPMHVVVHDSLSKLKESDIAAIATYMLDDDTGAGETVEPAKVAELTPKTETKAAMLYDTHCGPCHQKTGEGMKGKVPPLAGNPTVEATDPYNILSVVLGGVPARNGFLTMPSFADELSNQDIADIANYVRITWGNKAEPDTTPAMVASWREQVKPPAAAAKPETKKPAAEASKPSAGAAPAKTAQAAAPAAPPAAPTTDPLPKAKPYYILTSDIVGLAVHSKSDYGETLGTLTGLVIEATSGKTLYAIIDRGGFLGLGEYKVVVPFNLVEFTGQWDNPMLAMNAFKVENAPRITGNAIEDLLQSPDWRRSVEAYFGEALSKPKEPQSGSKETQVAKTAPEKTTAPKESAAAAEAEQGKQIAATQCSACHHFDKGGATLVGPDLYGVYGTKIASVPSYSFSAALKKHTGDWDAAKLDEWLENPSTFAPGTYMTFPGLPSQKDRDDVIAYLKSLK
jgi:cytochrome c2